MQYEAKVLPVTYEDGTHGEMTLQFPVREKSRVYIVGCAGTKTSVPWDDKDAEFWGVNNLYGVELPGQHYDRWFEIHNLWQDAARGKMLRRGSEDFRGQPIADYLHGLAKLGCTVYMQKHWPHLVPLSIPYPLDYVIKFFADKGFALDVCRYLTNTITYEIILAIYLGFTDIQVWGVDMAVGCLAPETRVLTSDLRWVASGDIEVGDELMAFDEEARDTKTRRWRTAKVTANPEIKRPCYRVTLEDGTEIVASAKHGWLTHGENMNRWKTTDQLITRHHRTGRPTKIVKLLETWQPDTSWEAPNVIGMLQAKNNVAVIGCEFIGDQAVMGLETDAKTYIAEGFASHNSEYEAQRPSCEFWLGVAQGLGIHVHIPPAADLLKTRFLYGFEEKQQDVFREKLEKIRRDMKMKRIQLENKHAQEAQIIQQSIGGEQVLGEVQRIWANLADDLAYQKRGS